MADPIQRVHFFDHQFLHVEDFTTEQDYHVTMRHLHNQNLHTPGVAQGLRVAQASGSTTAVVVRQGYAIDSQGRELVLTEDRTLELASLADNAAAWIVISYRENGARPTDETGAQDDTRTEEDPLVEALTAAPSDPDRLVLAKVTRGVTSNPRQIAGVDESGRTQAGGVEGDVLLTPRDPAVPAAQLVTLKWAGANAAELDGTLSIRPGATGSGGSLSVSGGAGVHGALTVDSGAIVSGGLAVVGGLSVRAGAGSGMTFADPATGASYQDGWLGMATNIEATKRWLHLGGITDAGGDGLRRLALMGDRIYASGRLGIGAVQPRTALDVNGQGFFRAVAWGGGAGVGAGSAGLVAGFDATQSRGFLQSIVATGTSTTLWLDGNPLVFAPGGTERARFDSGGQLIIGAQAGDTPTAKLSVVGGDIRWGNSLLTTDQGGSIELGGRTGVAGAGGVPYIDFHFGTAVQDYNVRLWNDADSRLSVAATTFRQNALVLSGGINWSSIAYNAFHTTAGGWAYVDATRKAMTIELDDSGGTPRFEIYSNPGGNVGAWTQRFRVDGSSGQVTIPSGALQVAGAISGGGTGALAGNIGVAGYSPVARNPGWAGGVHTFDLEAEASAWTMNLFVGKRGAYDPAGGSATFNSYVYVNAGKSAYVIDQFVNTLGDALEQGDVVVLSGRKPPYYYGTENQIPVPEVDLTEEAYDTRVCGIVEAVHGEIAELEEEAPAGGRRRSRRKPKLGPRIFSPEEAQEVDRATVAPGQLGAFVTLGAYAYCKVDADIAPIRVGDLLTTSPTKGHAQKVLEPERASGAVIGKAMGALARGQGKIPVLVTLH